MVLFVGVLCKFSGWCKKIWTSRLILTSCGQVVCTWQGCWLIDLIILQVWHGSGHCAQSVVSCSLPSQLHNPHNLHATVIWMFVCQDLYIRMSHRQFFPLIFSNTHRRFRVWPYFMKWWLSLCDILDMWKFAQDYTILSVCIFIHKGSSDVLTLRAITTRKANRRLPENMQMTAEHAHAYVTGQMNTFRANFKLSVHQNLKRISAPKPDIIETWYINTPQWMTTVFLRSEMSSHLKLDLDWANINMQTKYHSAVHVPTLHSSQTDYH